MEMWEINNDSLTNNTILSLPNSISLAQAKVCDNVGPRWHRDYLAKH